MKTDLTDVAGIAFLPPVVSAAIAKAQPLIDFVGVVASLRDPGTDAEANAEIIRSLRMVAGLLVMRAKEAGIAVEGQL